MEKYSIIIPVYRGEKTITTLFEQIKEEFDAINLEFEVIFIFDCGSDNSWNVIKNLKKRFPQFVKGIQLSRNFGQHNAIICGFKYAIGECVITMDEDLQHSPKDIIKLIEKQRDGDFDVVYGVYSERNHPFFRNATSWLLKKLLEKGIPELNKDYTAFRLIKSRVAKKTIDMNNSYTFLDGYLSWITNNVSSVKVSHSNSQAGKSSYTLRKLIEHSINVFVTFSNFPIRLLTIMSISIFTISTGYAVYILLRKLLYNDLITGFAAIAVILGFGIGFILLGLGIIGEYLYRVNLKTTKRPNFIEKKII